VLEEDPLIHEVSVLEAHRSLVDQVEYLHKLMGVHYLLVVLQPIIPAHSFIALHIGIKNDLRVIHILKLELALHYWDVLVELRS